MMKSNGLNLLNKCLKEHRAFNLYDSNGLFARYEYDDKIGRYQSDFGYLTLNGVYEISKDQTDDRYIKFEGE